MNRREFVRGVGAAGFTLMAAGCSLPASAPPQAAKVRRIARLSPSLPSAAGADQMAAFRQGLRALGYLEGQNLLIEERYADGDDQFAASAAEVVRMQTEVILVSSSVDARIVHAATTTIPIVNAGSGNLVADGLAESLARPGGHITGFSTPSLGGKQMQLFQEAVPTLSRVAVLFQPRTFDITNPVQREPFETAARELGLELQFIGVGSVGDVESVFETAVRDHADGLVLLSSTLMVANQTRIAELAIESRLPTFWGLSEAPSRGGLAGYSPRRVDLFRRAAGYVDKILKGAKPADLPIEQPDTFDFVINLVTAQTLGLTIPPAVLVQATEIIQ